MFIRAGLGALAASSIIALAACGGGGDNDAHEAPKDNRLTVSVDKTAVSWRYSLLEGIRSSPAVVFTGRGTANALYILAVTPSGQPDPNISRVSIVIDPVASTATASIVPAAGLSIGTYSGTLVLKACPVIDCATQYAGSPQTIDYSFQVYSDIALSPSEYGTVLPPATASSPFDVSVSLPSNVSAYTATPSDSWIAVTNVRPRMFTITLAPGALGTRTGSVLVAAGTYRATLTVTQRVE